MNAGLSWREVGSSLSLGWNWKAGHIGGMVLESGGLQW